MSWWRVAAGQGALAALLMFGQTVAARVAFAQSQGASDDKSPAPAAGHETPPAADDAPPEEDKSATPKEDYSFNPVQSGIEVKAGNFYFTKGNYTAAASRFLEATKWNSGNAEAWMRLGEADEKKSDAKGAREAYQKYLELAPDAKNAGEIKKRLAKLKG